MPLSSSQRSFLKKLAHHMTPTVYVGKQGITDTVIRAVEEVLMAHELIKIKFVDRKDEKRALTESVTAAAGAEVVGTLGHIVTLFREHPDPERRRIRLP